MKKILFTLISMLAFVTTASAQSMKVYQNGQLKAIYYVSKDDKVEFSDDFPIQEGQNYKENGHEYVDLGLSVKWATCNIGANSPEEYGGYYAWGETETKITYNKGNYKWYDGTNLTKYTTCFLNSQYGDDKYILEPNDDVVQVKWGGNWRMPTAKEMEELIYQCTWTWTAQSGVNGYKVTSKINGKSIFLPATGLRSEGDLKWAGITGQYWSSDLSWLQRDCAEWLCFDENETNYPTESRKCRWEGCAVRAVCSY